MGNLVSSSILIRSEGVAYEKFKKRITIFAYTIFNDYNKLLYIFYQVTPILYIYQVQVDIENLNIDDFKPYSDRVFSVDNNHSSIDFFWESNSCLAIEYDYQEVKTYNIKEDVFTKWTFTGNNESPVINIKYIDE